MPKALINRVNIYHESHGSGFPVVERKASLGSIQRHSSALGGYVKQRTEFGVRISEHPHREVCAWQVQVVMVELVKLLSMERPAERNEARRHPNGEQALLQPLKAALLSARSDCYMCLGVP